jgi:hypothetical protein
MDNIVIRPFQEGIIEGINDILNFNKIYLNLYFVTLQPIEFTELDNISTRVKREERRKGHFKPIRGSRRAYL